MSPGDLVRVKLHADFEDESVVLWQDPRGQGPMFLMGPEQVGLVLARHVDGDRYVLNGQTGGQTGDQVMVLFGDRFGWAETVNFVRVT